MCYVAFLLLVLELALQLFYVVTVGQTLLSRSDRPLFSPNEHCGFRNKPNLQLKHNTNEFQTILYTNQQGFRVPTPGVEYKRDKDDDVFRIMLLGPSFAYGWGVNYENTFAAHLERLLQEREFGKGQRVELINAGVPALGPARQLRWYQHVGNKYQPNLVIQFIYGSMAVPTKWSLDDYLVREDGYLVNANLNPKLRFKALAKRSALGFYSWTVYSQLQQRSGRAEANDQIIGAGQEMNTHIQFDVNNEEVIAADTYYDELRQVVKSGSTRLLLVHFPLSYCIHRADISRWQHLGVRNVDGQIAYNEQYCEYLRTRGFECLNLTDDLIRIATEGKRLYFWLDLHWTVEGNFVSAETVANYLSPARETIDRE